MTSISATNAFTPLKGDVTQWVVDNKLVLLTKGPHGLSLIQDKEYVPTMPMPTTHKMVTEIDPASGLAVQINRPWGHPSHRAANEFELKEERLIFIKTKPKIKLEGAQLILDLKAEISAQMHNDIVLLHGNEFLTCTPLMYLFWIKTLMQGEAQEDKQSSHRQLTNMKYYKGKETLGHCCLRAQQLLSASTLGGNIHTQADLGALMYKVFGGQFESLTTELIIEQRALKAALIKALETDPNANGGLPVPPVVYPTFENSMSQVVEWEKTHSLLSAVKKEYHMPTAAEIRANAEGTSNRNSDGVTDGMTYDNAGNQRIGKRKRGNNGNKNNSNNNNSDEGKQKHDLALAVLEHFSVTNAIKKARPHYDPNYKAPNLDLYCWKCGGKHYTRTCTTPAALCEVPECNHSHAAHLHDKSVAHRAKAASKKGSNSAKPRPTQTRVSAKPKFITKNKSKSFAVSGRKVSTHRVSSTAVLHDLSEEEQEQVRLDFNNGVLSTEDRCNAALSSSRDEPDTPMRKHLGSSKSFLTTVLNHSSTLPPGSLTASAAELSRLFSKRAHPSERTVRMALRYAEKYSSFAHPLPHASVYLLYKRTSALNMNKRSKEERSMEAKYLASFLSEYRNQFSSSASDVEVLVRSAGHQNNLHRRDRRAPVTTVARKKLMTSTVKAAIKSKDTAPLIKQALLETLQMDLPVVTALARCYAILSYERKAHAASEAGLNPTQQSVPIRVLMAKTALQELQHATAAQAVPLATAPQQANPPVAAAVSDAAPLVQAQAPVAVTAAHRGPSVPTVHAYAVPGPLVGSIAPAAVRRSHMYASPESSHEHSPATAAVSNNNNSFRPSSADSLSEQEEEDWETEWERHIIEMEEYVSLDDLGRDAVLQAIASSRRAAALNSSSTNSAAAAHNHSSSSSAPAAHSSSSSSSAAAHNHSSSSSAAAANSYGSSSSSSGYVPIMQVCALANNTSAVHSQLAAYGADNPELDDSCSAAKRNAYSRSVYYTYRTRTDTGDWINDAITYFNREEEQIKTQVRVELPPPSLVISPATIELLQSAVAMQCRKVAEDQRILVARERMLGEAQHPSIDIEATQLLLAHATAAFEELRTNTIEWAAYMQRKSVTITEAAWSAHLCESELQPSLNLLRKQVRELLQLAARIRSLNSALRLRGCTVLDHAELNKSLRILTTNNYEPRIAVEQYCVSTSAAASTCTCNCSSRKEAVHALPLIHVPRAALAPAATVAAIVHTAAVTATMHSAAATAPAVNATAEQSASAAPATTVAATTPSASSAAPAATAELVPSAAPTAPNAQVPALPAGPIVGNPVEDWLGQGFCYKCNGLHNYCHCTSNAQAPYCASCGNVHLRGCCFQVQKLLAKRKKSPHLFHSSPSNKRRHPDDHDDADGSSGACPGSNPAKRSTGFMQRLPRPHQSNNRISNGQQLAGRKRGLSEEETQRKMIRLGYRKAATPAELQLRNNEIQRRLVNSGLEHHLLRAEHHLLRVRANGLRAPLRVPIRVQPMQQLFAPQRATLRVPVPDRQPAPAPPPSLPRRAFMTKHIKVTSQDTPSIPLDRVFRSVSVLMTKQAEADDSLVLDTGSDLHLEQNIANVAGKLATNRGEYDVLSANGSSMDITHYGRVFRQGRTGVTTKVTQNLASVVQLAEHDNTFTLDKYGCLIRHPRRSKTMWCPLIKGQYLLTRRQFRELQNYDLPEGHAGMREEGPNAMVDLRVNAATSGRKQLSANQLLRASQVRNLHICKCHPSNKLLMAAIKHGLYTGTSLTSADVRNYIRHYGKCPHCVVGKSTKPAYHTSSNAPATSVGERIYADIFIMDKDDDVSVYGGSKFMLLAIDSYSKYLTIVPLKSKHESSLQEALDLTFSYYHQYGYTIKELHTDSESNFIKCARWLRHQGIAPHFAPPHQHCQMIERAVYTIKRRQECVKASSPTNIPIKMYGELAKTCVHYLNEFPNSSNALNSPAAIFQKQQSIDLSKCMNIPFGTIGLCHNPEKKGEKASMCAVLGPAPMTYNAVQCFLFNTNKIVTRSEVTIYNLIPTSCPWKPKEKAINQVVSMKDVPTLPTSTDSSSTDEPMDPSGEGDIDDLEDQISLDSQFDDDSDLISTHEDQEGEAEVSVQHQLPSSHTSNPEVSEEVESSDEVSVTGVPRDDVINPTIGKRSQLEPKASAKKNPAPEPSTKKPVKTKLTFQQAVEFIIEQQKAAAAATNAAPLASPIPETRHSTRIRTLPYKLRNSASDIEVPQRFVSSMLCCTRSPHTIRIARTFKVSVKQALTGEHAQESKEAILDEIGNMLHYKVGHYTHLQDVPYDKRKNILQSFMFLKHKTTPSGEYERTKARFVGNGANQKEHMYDLISSSTVALSSVFLLFNIASMYKCKLASYDIKGAFLHAAFGPQDEVTYIRINKEITSLWIQQDPSSIPFVNDRGELLLTLDKFIYGLKQSPLKFQMHLNHTLMKLGYERMTHDECLFIKHVGADFSVLSTHVDDILQVSTNQQLYDELAAGLIAEYKDITAHEKAAAYLGMTIERTEDLEFIKMTQTGLLKQIVEKYPALPGDKTHYYTPATDDLFKIPAQDLSPLLDEKQRSTYLGLIMTLMYLARLTRPDILLPVTYLSSRTHLATERDNEHALRVVRYLENTINVGVIIHCKDLKIHVTCDASFGVHLRDGKGHTGFIVSLGSTHSYCHARSGKQKSPSLSSTDAEIIAMCESLKFAVWMRNLISELRIVKLEQIEMQQDNKSAILMTTDDSTKSNSKHILIKIWYVKHYTQLGALAVTYLSTNEMTADVLTKPKQGAVYYYHCANMLGMKYNDRFRAGQVKK